MILPNIFPSSWSDKLQSNDEFDYIQFNNLTHFKQTVADLTQIQNNLCGVTYKEALNDLLIGKSRYDKDKTNLIRNVVRKNLLKRGLITEDCYEHFKYAEEGTVIGVDISKYINGEPDCVITPTRQYVNFFYELYVNISYPWDVDNEVINDNIVRLLTTIEELERQHIFIKITLVFGSREVAYNTNLFSTIPLFSHKEHKSVEHMSSVLNERLLRKFYFAVMEDKYGISISTGYGYPIYLDSTISLEKTINEIELFTEIQTNSKRG